LKHVLIKVINENDSINKVNNHGYRR